MRVVLQSFTSHPQTFFCSPPVCGLWQDHQCRSFLLYHAGGGHFGLIIGSRWLSGLIMVCDSLQHMTYLLGTLLKLPTLCVLGGRCNYCLICVH